MLASASWQRSQPSRCASVSSLPRSLQLAVEVRREQRQVAPALLREPFGIDLREPELQAQALAGPEDQLRDRVLLHVDQLADLGVRAVLELAQRQHEPLPRLEPRVREPHLVLLPPQERSPLGVVLDRRRQHRLGHLRHGLLPLRALDLLQEEIAQGREQVRARRPPSPGRAGRGAGRRERRSPARDRPRRGRFRPAGRRTRADAAGTPRRAPPRLRDRGCEAEAGALRQASARPSPSHQSRSSRARRKSANAACLAR